MTVGSWTTGTYPSGGATKLHAAKAWSGGDGKTIPGRISHKDKWNNYTMCHQWFHSGNPNEIGTINPITQVYTKRTNHSWNTGAGSPLGSIGYSTFGDGTVSATFPTSQFSNFWTAREESKLLSKLLKKIKGHELHLGVSLAEVDKLAGTVLGTLRNLVYGLDDLRKLRFAAFARRFGARPPRKDRVERLRLLDISGRFLEMRYAWEPTIADVYEAAKAFEALSNGPRQYLNRARRRKSQQVGYRTNYCQVNQTVEVSRTYLFEMYEEMGAFRQMGLTDPLSIIWERIPFSFVVDWFMPIGTYLTLIGQIPFLKGRFLRTSSIRWNTSGTYQAAPFSGVDSASPSVNADWVRFNLERIPTSGPPSVPFPDFTVSGAVAGKRIQNAIALAHQIFMGDDSSFAYRY
jgi:hypothetical protein